MPPNQQYLTMGNYGMAPAYQPMAPFAMTQPQQAQPASWMPAPQQKMWPIATAAGPVAQPGFNYDTDMAGLMPTSTPLGGTPTNVDIMSQIGWNGGGAGAGQRGIMDSFLQQRNADGTTSGGYGTAALGALQGLGSLYLGMQQYNLAKDSLATSKEQFNRNFAVQKNLTNSQLEDRQRARVASNAGAYQSVGDYMNQNGVK